MGKIKSYLKRDSDVLRDTLALFFAFSIGIYKILFENQQLYSLIFGLALILGGISYVSFLFIKQAKK